MRKRQTVITLTVQGWILSDLVLSVTDIFAAFEPTYLLMLSFFVTVHTDFHTIIKKGIWFAVIENVEFYCLAFSCVHGSEIKPLGVTLGVDIVLHKEVVLVV